MIDLRQVRTLISNNQAQTAIDELNNIINLATDCDEAYFLLGNAYNKLGNHKEAISAYCKAIEINPNSPAKIALTQIREIMDFFNHDLYNP